VLAQEDDLFAAAQHRRPIGEASLQGVVAQQAVAEGVEGADLRVVVAVGHEPVDALDHLQSGPVGKRKRQDLGRASPLLGDEPCDAAADDRGLAGTGARDDEQGAVAVGDRSSLSRREVGEERRLDPQVRPGTTRRLRGQLLEDRELVR
jgi:hypothetical protein